MTTGATIGERVDALRKAQGWTQRELADTLGLTQGSISLIESNVNQPSIPVARKMAAAFGVSLDILLGRDEAASQPEKVTPQCHAD